MSNKPHELVYSESEAVWATKLSRQTLWKARKKGILKYIRVGRRILYPIEALQEFLKYYADRTKPVIKAA